MTDKARAAVIVSEAIKNGELVRPENCSICNRYKSDRAMSGYAPLWQSYIVAHHWAGYHQPLKVWFICQSCNVILGKRIGLTFEEASQYIAKRRKRAAMLKRYKAESRMVNNVLRHTSGLSFKEWMKKKGLADCVYLWDRGTHHGKSEAITGGVK